MLQTKQHRVANVWRCAVLRFGKLQQIEYSDKWRQKENEEKGRKQTRATVCVRACARVRLPSHLFCVVSRFYSSRNAVNSIDPVSVALTIVR